MDFKKDIKIIEDKIKTIKDDCFAAGRTAEEKALRTIVNSVHELASVVEKILEIHKVKQETVEQKTPEVKETKTSKGKQILMEDK